MPCSNWVPLWAMSSEPLPPLDLETKAIYDDLTPSAKQIIDEIRDMTPFAVREASKVNLWSEPMTPKEEIECEIDIDMDMDMDMDININTEEAEEMLEELELNDGQENERSSSRDTAEVLSEYDICDKV